MEELQSTEVLDREILEDARKKAYRILKTADDTVSASAAAWDKKMKRAVDTVRRKYAARSEKVRQEIMARLPLDKRRARSEYTEGLLQSSMDAFLSALPGDKLLGLLEIELKKRIAEYLDSGADNQDGSASWEVRFRGLEEAELRSLLKGLGVFSVTMIQDPLLSLPGKLPGLVIDTSSARISASVYAAAQTLLKDKRAELAEALLGGEASCD
ncbi:MAG: ATPase [Treponema sp.]|jgi:vacuolar-type H+-ATPase subunit E/Vma4|nr:ATPase [Treponema sp.]